jgi:hypothetical protein
LAEYEDIVLRIRQTSPGVWSGMVMDDDDVCVAGVSGCSTADQVREKIHALGVHFVRVEIMIAATSRGRG